ncbi:MAG: response regulator transcription factor [Patescibacteria group bacterium]|nr:response regulator transcription factor [Patescibacteria group bacterium]
MRILVIEDDKKIALAIKKGLEQESYAVDVVYDTKDDKLGLALLINYDLIILDRMLPGITDGLNICKKLREEGKKMPILILTAKDKINERVEGLDAGADDYLIKPFAFEELLARVKALLRRPNQALNQVLKVGDLSLDTQTFKVMRKNIEIKLSSTEFKLLEYLIRNKGRILTKDNIMEHVWDYDAEILPNTVEVFIGYLRNKIDKPFSNLAHIQTIRGFGYKIE